MPSRKTGENIVSKITWKGEKAIVHFSERKLELSINAFTEFRLYEGKSVSSSEMKKLVSYAKLDADYNYSLRLLSHKGYTEMELRQKLIAKGASEENRSKIVSMLKKQGFLDDEEYAKNYVEEALEIKCYDSKKIFYELANKGIREEIVKKIHIPKQKEKEAAERAFEAFLRRYSSLPKKKKKEKIQQALYQRGFGEETINELLNRVPENDPKADEALLRRELEKAITHYSRKYEGYDLRERIVAALLKKGYPYGEIKRLLEDDEYEID